MKYLKQIVIQILSTWIKIAFAQFIYIIRIALSWYKISFSGNLFPCFEARDSCSDYIAKKGPLKVNLLKMMYVSALQPILELIKYALQG